jgi:ankyrin repeat protein
MILQKRDNWRGKIWQHGTIQIMKTKLTPGRTNAEARRTQSSPERGINHFLRVSPRPPRLCVLPLLAPLLLCVFALIPAVSRAATNDLTALLQQGLFEEQANRNLDAAIASYQSLATQFDKDRQLAATAVFRLGECYRALGKTNEAAAQYQRILRDFSDEQTLATLSRQNLTGMGVSAPQRFAERLTTVVSRNPERSRELELVKKLQTMPLSEVRQVAPTLLTDGTLINLINQYNQCELDLVRLHMDYADENPQVKKTVAIRDEMGKKIMERLEGLSHAISLDLATSGNVADTSAEAGSKPVPDEEDQEIQRIQQMIQNSPDLINARVDGGTPLTKTATNGWIKVATYLIDHGADVNADWNGALYGAAKAGNRAMVELLLSRGADVNPKGYTGQTPLHIAVENGFQAVVEVLLASNANVNAQIGSGVTPLFLAAGRDNPKIVSLLLAHKADVNTPDQSGMTPLINAVYSGHPENVKLLLAAGANPNLVGSDDNSVVTGGRSGGRRGGGLSAIEGRTALSFAADRGTPEMVKLLLDAKADPNGGKLNAPLFSAIQKQAVASAELLLQAGANPNMAKDIDLSDRRNIPGVVGGYGTQRRHLTPLWLAIYMKQLPMVQLLLKFKADPNDSQTDGKPLLFSALSDTNTLEALLDAGAKVDAIATDSNGSNLNPLGDWTSLEAATSQSNVQAVQVLLEHGANPNIPDGWGNTPLHYAASVLADEKVFSLLLDKKANPNVRNRNGQTPLDLVKRSLGDSPWLTRFASRAVENDYIEKLITLLRQHGALDKLPDWDRIAVSRPSANFLQAVFRKGTNDWNQFTLLETICEFDQNDNRPNNPLAFADLSHVVVVRPSTDGATAKRIEVNLLNATNGVDFAKDMPLEFGDVVEIPEREHTLAEPAIYLPKNQFMAIFDYLRNQAGEAKLIVAGGQIVQLPLQEFFCQIGEVLTRNVARGVLTSSSDLSRVKVIRRDAKTGKTHEWIVDCSDHQSQSNPEARLLQARAAEMNGSQPNNSQPSPGLWLRNGDVIEVPEKP